MITQEEAIIIAEELKKAYDIASKTSWNGRGNWKVDSRTKDMMDYYNANRVQLKPPGMLAPLLPMSINCNPCIGKVVLVLLSLPVEK